MPTAGGGWFKKKSVPTSAPLRVLTAAATRLDMKDKKQSRQQRALRQGWQGEAWGYRDSIGELRYAIQFLANCTARMQLFPAAYAIGPDAGTDAPLPLGDIQGVPPMVADLCRQAMTELGNGRLAIAGLLRALSTNTTVAGECYLLGTQDPVTGHPAWTVRSIDEIVIRDDKYQMREVPTDPNGQVPWADLDPDTTVISRIWVEHPRFRLLADSPLRAILDDCESLLIMRRTIRATGRSRLAGAGMLLVPNELSISSPNEDNEDPEADSFLQDLTEAMMTPVAEEGVASAVVPIVIRGDAELLDKVKYLDFASSLDAESGAVRAELIGVIATGLDIPKEVIVGVADLNHWTAWQVDDNTFRHHVEPHVVTCCDSLTSAYLRPYLEANGCPDEWVQRCVVWYDPTELVTHPDQTADALQMHDRLAISDEALRRISGFDKQDAPTQQEIQVRLLEKMRQWPPNLVMAFLHAWDPTLIAPPIADSGQIPGIGPEGVVQAPPPPAPTVVAPAAPVVPSGGSVPPPEALPPAQTSPGPPPAPVVASGKVAHVDLSRQLVDIDRELRTKLQTAACAAMHRHLDKTGARLRSKVAKDETLRTKIAHYPNSMVASVLGEDVVSIADITGGDWSTLKAQYSRWVEDAQSKSIKVACQIGGLSADGPEAKKAIAAMSDARSAGWRHLESTMTRIGNEVLYNPDPNGTAAEFGDINPDTLVPTGDVRVALAIAGGSLPGGA